MLAVLVVLTLLPTWSDGLLLTKCQLKSQLEAAFQGGLSKDIIAKLTCAAEHVSGFNSSFRTTTDQSDPRTLIVDPFIFNIDEDHGSGMGEIIEVKAPQNEDNSATGQGRKRRAVPSADEADVSLMSADEDHGSGLAENMEVKAPQNEENSATGQGRKRRAAPPADEADVSLMSGDDEGSEVHQGTPDPTQIHYDTFEMLFGIRPSPPETRELTDIPTKVLELDAQTASAGVHYDSYEMLYPFRNHMTRPQGTTGPPETKSRYKRGSGDPTTLYGIFQLSDIACNSGSSQSLNLCRLDCSALTDDDIADDIACLKTLNMMPLMSTQECADTANYFTECG